MRMDTSIKLKKKLPGSIPRGGIIAAGVSFLVIAIVVLVLSLWEGFFKSGRMHMIEVPGFHELNLETPGLYAGVYQHRGTGPLPIQTLSNLDVRIMSKDEYEEVPVLMNDGGQTFERFGLRGMPLFNFVIENPGVYTMSAVHKGAKPNSPVSIFVIPQAVRNIKQTLIVGLTAFLFFLSAGIFVLVKVNKWTPRPAQPN